MVLLVGGYMVVRITAPSDTRHAQLRFVDNGVAKTFNGESGSQDLYQEPLSGAAYETALRLREAGALGLSVSLSVFAKQAATGNAPLTHRDVIREMITRKLIPPGIDVENGSLRSYLSELRFSYRNEPLSFEILSLPKHQATSSGLLFRFPLPAGESNAVMYFESASSAQIPGPFSTTEQITGAGWKIRHWRGEALPLNESIVGELREQNDWLKSRDQGQKQGH
ncbi:MAG: hypothetical protein KF855_17095 [Acidobacteria bacterium]|nr:hypothetical protein [Acidobacteriota bacterium]